MDASWMLEVSQATSKNAGDTTRVLCESADKPKLVSQTEGWNQTSEVSQTG